MDLDETFSAAADVVQKNSLGTDGKSPLDEKKLLELYGLYKVATVGRCNEPQPGMFNLKAKAKWAAWKKVSEFTGEDAKVKYIQLVQSLLNWTVPTTDDESYEGENSHHKGSSSLLGNIVSSFAIPTETDEDEDSNADPVFSWTKDCNLPQLNQWIKNTSNVDIKDQRGMTPLHWATDRGHLVVCKLLLENGADPLISDDDGTTPLEYAETCEYDNIVALLHQYIHS